jgi:nucleotide-binding universal stress UspA family protein
MLPIRTILVPVDFSGGSMHAFGLAQALAHDYGARIVVAHVVEPPRAMGVEGVLVFQPEINWEGFRCRLAERYAADEAIRVEYLVVEGTPADEIVRLAGDYHADVIVIGTHGRTGLPRLIMGSVAEKVLRRAPCPVVTVKRPVPVPVLRAPKDQGEILTMPAGIQEAMRL